MSNQMWIDEINLYSGYFQKEPSPYEQMLQVMFVEPEQSNRRIWGVEAQTRKEFLRKEERRKRKKAMENCQHGRRSFPIYYSEEGRKCLT